MSNQEQRITLYIAFWGTLILIFINGSPWLIIPFGIFGILYTAFLPRDKEI